LFHNRFYFIVFINLVDKGNAEDVCVLACGDHTTTEIAAKLDKKKLIAKKKSTKRCKIGHFCNFIRQNANKCTVGGDSA